tara:strand:- start:10351 stop:12084 length:1734 start_codon:yes stop_codon:yes gene_type:complete
MDNNFKAVTYIIKPFKWRYIFVVVIAMLAAIFESIGYYSLIPLLDILIGKSNIEYNLFGKSLTLNDFTIFHEDFIVGIGLFIISIFITRFSLKILRLYTTQKLNWDVRNYYTEKLSRDYTNSTLLYLNSQKHGEILNNAFTETNRSAAAITALIELFSQSSLIVILYLSLFNTNFHITLIITGLLLLIWFIIRKYVVNFSKNIGSNRLIKSQQLTTLASESFSAIRNSKIFNAQNVNLKRLKNRLIEYSKILLKYNVVLGLPTPVTELVLVFSFVGLVMIFNESSTSGLNNFSGITIYFLICQRIFQYSSNLISQRVKYLSLLPSLRLIKDLLIKELPKENLIIGQKINDVKLELCFSNVSFSYENNKDVLRNINLSIAPNGVTAIFGESGIGKSTIADLILRLYKPSKGEILIDGNNIDNYNLLDWRDKIGYVSQDPFFYNESVIYNLLIGNEKLDRSEVIKICKSVNAHNFIEELKESYDTIIGDRAVLLSGGQKQRLALVRALTKNPDILILDEATSALDAINEKIINDFISKLSKEKTIIMISHNTSNLKIADKIFCMTKTGEIIEKELPDFE